MSHTGGWEAARSALRQRVGPSAFSAWLESVQGRIEDDRLVLQFSDRFSRDWVRERYGEAIRDCSPAGSDVEYRLAAADERKPHTPAREGGVREGGAREPRTRARRTQPAVPDEPRFASFVAGPGNAFALEAARSVARGEGGRVSPLVIAAESGLGKTHLCRAIRSELLDVAEAGGVTYRSAEEFTAEVTEGIRAGQMSRVRQRYRRATNVLILEDVQFLAGKKATQIELFHTLDHLLARGLRAVFSAARPPREIDGLDPALASRLGSGLVATITPPERDSRLAILRAKAAGGGVRVPESCLELLAARPVRSVRDLLAGLNQVVARATLLKQAIDPELVAQALAAVEVPARMRTTDEIIGLVSRAYGLTPEQLRARTRKRHVSHPRQLAMYLCRRYTNCSFKQIGRAFGRDHTSVIYAVDAVERRVLEQPQLRYTVETLVTRL